MRMASTWLALRARPLTPTTTAAVGSTPSDWNSSRRGMAIWTRAEVMPRIDMMVRDSSPCRARCSLRFCWNSVWPSTDWLSNSS